MKLLLAAILIATSLIPAAAQSLNCSGFPPLPPLGCRNAHCVCNSANQCQWVYDCG